MVCGCTTLLSIAAAAAAAAAVQVGGDLIFEWPAENMMWRLPCIDAMCSLYRLIPVTVNGCMVGLTDSSPEHRPLFKPWTLMTTVI